MPDDAKSPTPTADIPDAVPERVNQDSDSVSETSIRRVLSLLKKVVRSRELRQNDQAALDVLREAATLTRTWLRDVEAHLQKHGLEPRKHSAPSSGHPPIMFAAVMPLMISALVGKKEKQKGHSRKIRALADLHEVLSGHLEGMERDIGNSEAVVEGREHKRKRRRRESERSPAARGSRPRQQTEEHPEKTAEGIAAGEQASAPQENTQDREPPAAPTGSTEGGSVHSEANGDNREGTDISAKKSAPAEDQDTKERQISAAASGRSSRSQQQHAQVLSKPPNIANRRTRDLADSDASIQSASKRSSGSNQSHISVRGEAQHEVDKEPKGIASDKASSKSGICSPARSKSAGVKSITSGSRSQRSKQEHVDTRSSSSSSRRSSAKEAALEKNRSDEAQSPGSVSRKSDNSQQSAIGEKAKLEDPAEESSLNVQREHSRAASRHSGRSIVSRHGSNVSSAEEDAVSEIDLIDLGLPTRPKKCHHPPSQASGCPSRAWSCEVEPDGNGGLKLDPEHVHKRAGGCS